jgi:hypothetical protein
MQGFYCVVDYVTFYGVEGGMGMSCDMEYVDVCGLGPFDGPIEFYFLDTPR